MHTPRLCRSQKATTAGCVGTSYLAAIPRSEIEFFISDIINRRTPSKAILETMYTITRLTKHHVLKLQKLNELFGAVFEDTNNYQAHPPRAEYLADFLAQGQNIVLVAEHNGQVIGGLVAYCLTKFEQERKEVYLYDLAVSTSHQRQGIGKTLMNELRAVAKSLGAYIVFVQADEGDEAVAFYESLGPVENLRARNFDFNVS